jgi:hypothetical protein
MRAWFRLAVVSVTVGAAAASTGRAQTPAPTALRLADKVAEYLTPWVASLANVVAQEDFELATGGRTKNQVRSEFLFVQDPVTRRDWLTFRDVFEVNGVPRPDRQTRLQQLFLEPPQNFVQRAREITLDSSSYVPVVLNPYFGVSFLQRTYHSRFRFSTRPAGGDWAPGVVGLTFLETGRPTLLRLGAGSEQDAPARGTAWVEANTGRVLATELQVNTGRSTATVHTTFAPDERLGIMLPRRMQTKQPDGEAAYTNFRRFDVRTEADVQQPILH